MTDRKVDDQIDCIGYIRRSIDKRYSVPTGIAVGSKPSGGWDAVVAALIRSRLHLFTDGFYYPNICKRALFSSCTKRQTMLWFRKLSRGCSVLRWYGRLWSADCSASTRCSATPSSTMNIRRLHTASNKWSHSGSEEWSVVRWMACWNKPVVA